jgi:hypothetical protein
MKFRFKVMGNLISIFLDFPNCSLKTLLPFNCSLNLFWSTNSTSKKIHHFSFNFLFWTFNCKKPPKHVYKRIDIGKIYNLVQLIFQFWNLPLFFKRFGPLAVYSMNVSDHLIVLAVQRSMKVFESLLHNVIRRSYAILGFPDRSHERIRPSVAFSGS